MSRGLKINNPGNIRRSSVVWQGQADVQPDPDFVAFISPLYGIRALARNLITYASYGIDTVSEIITKWAPPEDHNDTPSYIADVCHACGVQPDELLDTVEMLPHIIPAIIKREQGSQPFSDELIAQAIELAKW